MPGSYALYRCAVLSTSSGSVDSMAGRDSTIHILHLNISFNHQWHADGSDVNNKEYDYQMGVHYMDIITECEKLGDYVVNVVEAGSNVKEKKA